MRAHLDFLRGGVLETHHRQTIGAGGATLGPPGIPLHPRHPMERLRGLCVPVPGPRGPPHQKGAERDGGHVRPG
eukprot:5108119-Lingulodinium_polyedra.AAC.1